MNKASLNIMIMPETFFYAIREYSAGGKLVIELSGYVFQASGEDALALPCLYILIVFIIMLALYAGLKIYNHYYGEKKTRQHLCEYCGHMVDVTSSCCHAPVTEKFLHGICQNCGKESQIVCKRCHNRV